MLIRQTLPHTAAAVAESRKALGVAAVNGLAGSTATARIHTNPRNAEAFRSPSPAERAAARSALGVRPEAVTVGMLGRLVPEKGVPLFLDTACSLLDDRFDGQFLVAGAGPLQSEVLRRSGRDLIALGQLTYPEDVVTLFHALDVLVCSSLTTPSWEDQGPRSLLEGMMCGCVPVGTPTGAIAEMMDGHGVLADSTEPASLGGAIRRAAAMAAVQQERLGIAQWAASEYSAAAVAGQLRSLWSGLVAGSPSTAAARR